MKSAKPLAFSLELETHLIFKSIHSYQKFNFHWTYLGLIRRWILNRYIEHFMETFYFIAFSLSYFFFFPFKLVFFGLSNQMVVAFKEDSTIAFKHLFLKGYVDQTDDTHAVYTQSDVYNQIIFSVNQVSQVCASFFSNVQII